MVVLTDEPFIIYTTDIVACYSCTVVVSYFVLIVELYNMMSTSEGIIIDSGALGPNPAHEKKSRRVQGY